MSLNTHKMIFHLRILQYCNYYVYCLHYVDHSANKIEIKIELDFKSVYFFTHSV